MKVNFSSGLAAGLVAGTVAGLLAGAGVLHAQQTTPAAPAAEPVMLKSVSGVVPGTLNVTRLTDTTFVVVKDQGDAQVVTLFSTEGGIVKKLHSGKFLY